MSKFAYVYKHKWRILILLIIIFTSLIIWQGEYSYYRYRHLLSFELSSNDIPDDIANEEMIKKIEVETIIDCELPDSATNFRYMSLFPIDDSLAYVAIVRFDMPKQDLCVLIDRYKCSSTNPGGHFGSNFLQADWWDVHIIDYNIAVYHSQVKDIVVDFIWKTGTVYLKVDNTYLFDD